MNKNKRHKRRIKCSIKFFEKYKTEKICKTKYEIKIKRKKDFEQKIGISKKWNQKNKINKNLIKI